ncbi:MAG: hypothetical protein QXR18_09715 [Pyrobaculum sp.]
MEIRTVEGQIIDLLKKVGSLNAYEVVRRLNLQSYGVTEYYLTRGAIKGLWKLTKIANKVIVHLPNQDPLTAVTASDVVKCLRRYAKDGEPVAKIYDYLRLCLPT